MLMPMISCEATSFAVSFTCVRVSVWERARARSQFAWIVIIDGGPLWHSDPVNLYVCLCVRLVQRL